MKTIQENDLLTLFNLISEIENKNAIAFLGAGFSYNFSINNWKNFILELNSEFEFYFKNNISLYELEKNEILDNLKKLSEAIKRDEIKLDFALDLLFNIVKFDQINENSKEYGSKIKIIKEQYKKNFLVDSNFFIKNGTSNADLLDDFTKKISRVITTNYDNLLLWKYPIESQQKILLNQTIKTEEIVLKDSFFLPIHGNVIHDYIISKADMELNPWKEKEFFPIIDSFSSFKKNYSSNKSKQVRTIKAVFENVMKSDNNDVIFFFGYSFDDYFVSSELNKILLKYKNKKYTKTKIYIFYDDFERKLFNGLKINFKGKICEINSFYKKLDFDFVEYINLDSINKFMRTKKSKYEKHYIKLEEEIKNKQKDIFEICGEKNYLNIIFEFFKNSENYANIRFSYYDTILDYIKGFYVKVNEKLMQINKIIDSEISNEKKLWKKAFMYIFFYRNILKYDSLKTLDILKNSINKKLIYIYIYALMYYENEIYSDDKEYKIILDEFLKYKTIVENTKNDIELFNEIFLVTQFSK
ncbi:hypothetical protein MENTO_v1c03000 [Mesoplasma entomophilum]|uniref:Uncharacterized protein n=1 Tax=Mesoplasma entomophilum TaxID=2149 RepID=A0A3S5XYW6_9MOLU|nr:SIR2 family protein [Mesoplasma entomophilum]ATQ35448.1 hypothetical protein CS528_01550 [Mesoplasma entomophilum]ATZ19407.1 hypothetical protein MENTO_v1c03000 [Mesoplasma entomophilum]